MVPGSLLQKLERLTLPRSLASRAPAPFVHEPTAASTWQSQNESAYFSCQSTAFGPLWNRIVEHSQRYRFGISTLGDAQSACRMTLALLAQDPALAGVEPKRFLYLDTETTGLRGGAGTLAFLVGFAWFSSEKALTFEQLLVRNLGEELPVLQRLSEAVANADCLVSFNGGSFDLPLLQTRLIMNHLPPLALRPHLDLLRVAQFLHGRRLGGCSLAVLETKLLGFQRSAGIAGRDIAARYRDFLRSGDDRQLQCIAERNELDVLSLVALVDLYGRPINTLGHKVVRPVQRALPGFESIVPVKKSRRR